MNVLIIGAGEVGGHLARLLSMENHNITIVDHDPERLASIGNSLDVMTVEGHGTSPSTLSQANISKMDMVIAVTTVDEVNILACTIAKQFGVTTKIARIRNREFSASTEFLNPEDFGIDQIIHPELEATREIIRLIRYPEVLEMITFCEESIIIAGLRVMDASPISGMQLQEIDQHKKFAFRIVAINRNGNTIFPRGTDHIEVDDHVYITFKNNDLKQAFSMVGHTHRETRDVMIYGATSIGRMVASELEKEKSMRIKLLESSRAHGQSVAEELPGTQVVVGDASDIDLVVREGITDVDVFAALSDDDEDNIVTSLLARHLQVPKTITLIGKTQYVPIVKTIGLDVAINPRLLTSNAILKYIRMGKILSLRHMVGIAAETYEFLVSPSSKVVGKMIREIKFPRGSIVVAVEHADGAEIPVGETHMYVGDRVVVFCVREAVNDLLKLFK